MTYCTIKNPEAPASKRQLWLLHILTKQDTRILNITMAQANDLIKKAQYKTKPIETSTGIIGLSQPVKPLVIDCTSSDLGEFEDDGGYYNSLLEDKDILQDYKHDVMANDNLARLLPIWKRTQKVKDEKPYLTLREYRELTGKRHPLERSLNDKTQGQREPSVSWEEGIDCVIGEFGGGTPDELWQRLDKLGRSLSCTA